MDVTIWATVGEVERRGPFLPLPPFAPTMITSKWDEEKDFLFRFCLFQRYYHCTTWLLYRSDFNSHCPPTDSIGSSNLISTGFLFLYFFLPRLSRYELQPTASTKEICVDVAILSELLHVQRITTNFSEGSSSHSHRNREISPFTAQLWSREGTLGLSIRHWLVLVLMMSGSHKRGKSLLLQPHFCDAHPSNSTGRVHDFSMFQCILSMAGLLLILRLF